MLSLQFNNVKFLKRRAVLTLRGKSGNRFGVDEQALVDCPYVVAMLRRLPTLPTGKQQIIQTTGAMFRERWRWAVTAIGLSRPEYDPYSIRGGGATQCWIDHGDSGLLCVKGRWPQHSTARLYAVEAQEMLGRCKWSADTRAKIEYWQGIFVWKLQTVLKEDGF